MDPGELATRPMSGAAWNNLLSAANQTCTTPDLENQDDPANVCVMAKALVYARTGQAQYYNSVVTALWSLINAGLYNGRALSLGRELGAYVISADLINLKGHDPNLDAAFRTLIRSLLTTPTIDGPVNLIDCHEKRPNNWGTHCGASRAAVAAYLGDTAQLARIAQVFKGWLGDRVSYAGFSYGDLWWQCDPAHPVGINPTGCTISGHSVDGVLPDDQRRAGSFTWPPQKENYVYEALQGALAQAVILKRAGYDVFNWQNRALLRAFQWLYTQDQFPATGDDTWEPYLVNYFYYGTISPFPVTVPSQSGKNVGWTDWTHPSGSSSSGSSGSTGSGSTGSGSTTTTLLAAADTYVEGGSQTANFGTAATLEVKDASSAIYDRHALLRFDLTKVTTGVSTATLKLHVSDLPNGTPVPVCVFAVASDSWSETKATWKNQPTAGSQLTCQSIGATGWVAFDVTGFVSQERAGDHLVSFMLMDQSQANRMGRFDSREAAGNVPALEIK
jgi:hypothetical protein